MKRFLTFVQKLWAPSGMILAAVLAMVAREHTLLMAAAVISVSIAMTWKKTDKAADLKKAAGL